jgi:hypothetical protein
MVTDLLNFKTIGSAGCGACLVTGVIINEVL